MRIALISDIHYGALSTTSELAVNGEKLAIGEIQNASPLFQGLTEILKIEKPDYLFIAGDLTSTGSPLEFNYCYQKIQKLGNDAGIESSNIVFCLGNHDIDWRISKLADSYMLEAGATNNIAYLKDQYQKLAHIWSIKVDDPSINIFPNYVNKHSTPLTGVVEFSDCVVFVLNSGHLCTHDQEYKHGYLSNSQFEWFNGVVHQYKQTTKVKIVLLHHHPFNYPYPLRSLDISTLEEGSELLQLCGEAGVDLVLHGHRHHPRAKTVFETGWIKPVTYICSGSLSVNASERLGGYIPNTFHIIDYNNSDEIILSNYLYDPTSGWLLITEEREHTVEGKMWLGKIIDEQDAIKLIKELPKNQPIEYQSLKADLRYLHLNKLNELVQRVHGKDYRIYDHFPNAIYIISSEEG